MNKKIKKVEIGSIWSGADMKLFQVTDVKKDGMHVWVHYKQFKPLENNFKSYSCYQEAFVGRFFEFNNIHSYNYCRG